MIVGQYKHSEACKRYNSSYDPPEEYQISTFIYKILTLAKLANVDAWLF